MSDLTTYQQLLDDRVRDAAAKLTSAQKVRAIQRAVTRYSQLRPVPAVQDYAGNGVTFDFTLPADWDEQLSNVLALEYPAGRRDPVLLTADDWTFYRASSTSLVLRLRSITPKLGETLRLTYGKRHVVDLVRSTIPQVDEHAVADFAAAAGLRDLAATYANTIDPTIAADAVNYRSKADEYLRLAKELEKSWEKHMGLDADAATPAAFSFTDVDQTPSYGGDKLTHPNRDR